jgi:uncharacterized protein
MHDQLLSVLRQNAFVMQVVEAIPELQLPNCYVAGACLAQTFWNLAHHKEPHADIKDIDLVYFDPNLSQKAEADKQISVRSLFKHLPVDIDVINEARVHLWYESSFGYAIKPYASVEEAITTFPITAGVIGVRKEGSSYKVFAPLGFDDLFNNVVRPNKKQITKDIYEAKLKRWQPCWPTLHYVSWEES